MKSFTSSVSSVFAFLGPCWRSAMAIPEIAGIPGMISPLDAMLGISELPEGMSGISELPEGMLGISELPEGMPGISELPEGMPGISELPEGMSGMSELPEGMLGMSELPGNMPATLEGINAGGTDVGSTEVGISGTPVAGMVLGLPVDINVGGTLVYRFQWRSEYLFVFTHAGSVYLR